MGQMQLQEAAMEDRLRIARTDPPAFGGVVLQEMLIDRICAYVASLVIVGGVVVDPAGVVGVVTPVEIEGKRPAGLVKLPAVQELTAQVRGGVGGTIDVVA